MIDAAGGWSAVALRFVAFTATTGALGAWAFVRFVLPALGAAVDERTHAAWQTLASRAAMWCGIALAATSIARLAGPFATIPDVALTGRALLQSAAGQALLVQGVAGALVGGMIAGSIASSPPAARRWPATVEAALTAIALLPPALAHAASAPTLRFPSLAVDLIHGLAAGAWIGALALVATVITRARHAEHGAAHATALFAAFHRVAVIAAPTVFVTGLLSAWLRMGAPEGIASPTYSGLFVAKLLLVGVTGFIGAGHSKLATKRTATVSAELVGRSLLAECAFALAVLVVTAVLVGTAPIA
ncbi:MAG: CopD family protein [Gemmatimonadetes bacterium]|nr:CopD family protein [Gemmatimonadota bacterium]